MSLLGMAWDSSLNAAYKPIGDRFGRDISPLLVAFCFAEPEAGTGKGKGKGEGPTQARMQWFLLRSRNTFGANPDD